MKVRFDAVVRACLFTLLAVLLYAVWSAQAQTNAPADTNTATALMSNAVAQAEAEVVQTFSVVRPEWVQALAERVPFLKHRVLGNELWKYLFSLLYIFLAFYVSKFLDYFTRVWLKRLADKTQSRLGGLVLSLLNGPVKLVTFVIFLRIGLDVFQWPDLMTQVLSKGFAVAVAATVTYVALKLVDALMGFWHTRTGVEADATFNQQLIPILRKTLKVFLIVIAALVTLSNIGVNVTAAIASLSIGGLAIGLAAQDTLANLFGAVAVFLDKPFKVGDRVQLDGVDGTVEAVGMRSTRVRNLDGHLVTIPNKTVGNATITNISKRPNIKTIMNIGVTYDTPTEKVQRALAILQEVYRGHTGTQDVWLSFNKFADSSLNILVIHWWGNTDYKAYLTGLQEMNLTVKQRFDEEGISFAFPTQTLHVKQDSDWRIGQAAP